ncbi:MAG TPA: Re/Si-specific NAD(P)(+) transhydrogenase subunit alpha [Kofleriaceae bacterium]|nr:Re/Si-specific NAD(P)(+) transhydrogenase subunit alpha [Kofleriaceae bacterium]
MKLGIVKEIRPDERRVAASPTTVARWIKAGWDVVVERGAGDSASFPEKLYTDAGASIAAGAADVWRDADIVLKVRPPTEAEAMKTRSGQTVISFIHPAMNAGLVEMLRGQGATVLGMDAIPRISRAQKVDALSSMANISGYRAVVEAANRFGSFFTGQMTAAGKVAPAKVLIIGAGVAGLAAIGAAKGLGAIVRAFDVRPSVGDQIRSLGAEFLTVEIEESGEGQGGYAKEMSKEFIDAEMALFRAQAKDVNIVITTALIPGKPAPKLWLADMVESMKPGSVVVDMAAEQGGNCEATQPGKEIVTPNGVTVLGFTDFPSRMANVSSELYGTNLWHLLDEMGGAAGWKVDTNNDIVRGALITHAGEKMWPPPPPKEAPKPAPPKPAEVAKPAETAKPAAPKVVKGHGHGHGAPPAPPSRTAGLVMSVVGIIAAVLWLGLRVGKADATVGHDTAELLQHMTVFVLAVFVGWQIVWNVTPALHTPLMSVTNAISGIIVVGGILGARQDSFDASVAVAVAATLFATINIAGGFLVTRRMLAMFRK